MLRNSWLNKIKRLKQFLKNVKKQEPSSVRDVQISALEVEILRLARKLENLDRTHGENHD